MKNERAFSFKKSRAYLGTILLFLMLSLSLAGCGSKSSDEAANPSMDKISDTNKNDNGDDAAGDNDDNDSQATDNSDEDSEADDEPKGPINITLHTPKGNFDGTYDGDFGANNIPDGDGMFTSHDEDGMKWTYRGSFTEGLFDGDGVCTWENGDEFYGAYSNGQRNGPGRLLHDGVLLYEGVWADDICVKIDRQSSSEYKGSEDTTGSTDSGSMQKIKWDERGFEVPKAWDVSILQDDIIDISVADNTRITVQKIADNNVYNKASMDMVKAGLESIAGFENATLIFENYDSDSRTYEIKYIYDNPSGSFPADVHALAFQKGRDFYIITTINDGIFDHFEDSKCIYDSFTTWSLMD